MIRFRDFASIVLIGFMGAAPVQAEALATRQTVLGAVHMQVPIDFVERGGAVAKLFNPKTNMTIDVSELPPEALIEFSGDAFLDFLQSVGYANAKYAPNSLPRSDTHTYVTADAAGADGPRACSLLVLGTAVQAAIVTICVPKDDKASDAAATRATTEAILLSAEIAKAEPH